MTGVYLDDVAAPATGERQTDILALLGDRSTLARRAGFLIEEAQGAAEVAAYRRLRRDVFVHEQGLFTGDDLDERDADPRTVVLVARGQGGEVVGGVRLGPVADGADIGWWAGGRLVVAPRARG
ncbi:AIR synthase, partial [Streptomyces sp. NPDC005917]